MRLNLGCWRRPLDGFVNVDLMPPADVVHDLTVTPWPFPDDSVEYILAEDVLEHLPSFAQFMNECNRVLEPGGMLEIIVPRPSDNFWLDPTHVRPYCKDTFYLFCTDDDLTDSYLGIVPWSNVWAENLDRPQVPAVHAQLIK